MVQFRIEPHPDILPPPADRKRRFSSISPCLATDREYQNVVSENTVDPVFPLYTTHANINYAIGAEENACTLALNIEGIRCLAGVDA